MKWHQPFKRPVYAAIASTLALSLSIGAVQAQESHVQSKGDEREFLFRDSCRLRQQQSC